MLYKMNLSVGSFIFALLISLHFYQLNPYEIINQLLQNFILFFQLSNDRGESSLVNVSETDSGALDLSSGSRDRENMKSRSSVASHHSHHRYGFQ